MSILSIQDLENWSVEFWNALLILVSILPFQDLEVQSEDLLLLNCSGDFSMHFKHNSVLGKLHACGERHMCLVFSLQLFFEKFFNLIRNYRVKPWNDGLQVKHASCWCCCWWWWSSAVIAALFLLSDICASDSFGFQHNKPSEVQFLRKRESCRFRSVVYKLDVHCYYVYTLRVILNETIYHWHWCLFRRRRAICCQTE